MRGAVHKVPMGPRRASPTRQSPALSAIMSRRMANAQLRMLQSCGLPGLEGGAPSKRGKPGQTRKRQRGAPGKEKARKRRRSRRPVRVGGDRKPPIALQVQESKLRTKAIMSDVEKEQDARAREKKRARRTLRALKTRKSDVVKNTLAALLARK